MFKQQQTFNDRNIIVYKMNKNNKSLDCQTRDENAKTKNKHIQGKSQFTRGKLQRDYEPKLKQFKHKLLKTSQHQKSVFQRIQNQQDEQKVTSNALQCFKKGQLIDLDWKTRSNFRKSNIGLRFPRINTQPLQTLLQNSRFIKSNRSNLFEAHQSISNKNKSIENKCNKLKDLLGLQNGQSRSFFKSSKSSQINQSKQNRTKSMFFLQQDKKSLDWKEKNKTLQKDSIVNSPVAGLSVNLSEYLPKSNSKSQTKNEFNFQNLRSQTEQLQSLKVSEFMQNKSQRKKQGKSQLDRLSSHEQVIESQKNQNSHNQNSIQQKATISTQKQKSKVYEGYDILNDPNMYMLIQKTRQRIMDFKQSLSLKKMSKLQRIRYLEQKKAEEQGSDDRIRSKSLTLQKNLGSSKISRDKIIQKIESKKKSISEKINKDVSRVFTQIEEYVKNAQIQQSKHYSQICQYLNLKTSDEVGQNTRKYIFQGNQSKIKKRKKQSLVQVQQKLLKQVKLSFLKEDLTKKFQQIRNYQQNSNNFQ